MNRTPPAPFAVSTVAPVYCSITDGLIGSRRTIVHKCRSAAEARFRAADLSNRLHAADSMDDIHVEAVEAVPFTSWGITDYHWHVLREPWPTNSYGSAPAAPFDADIPF